MSRPAVEVADILHAQGDTFLEQHPWLSAPQRSVLRAIARCRTAALGGHLDRCDTCGYQAISYNSCRNRHCMKYQAQARERWLHARQRELLDVPYVHVVFTLPHGLLSIADRNSARLYTWLFHASAATLRDVAADPRHLGAEIGVLSILHTWGQTLVRHPHVHCVVPAGGLSPDHQRWIHPTPAGFFLPVKILSRVFRGKFVEALRRAYDRNELDLSGAMSICVPQWRGAPSSTPSSKRTGLSTPNQPSGAHPPSSGISGATPIASRSAITGCSPSTATT
jgi:Transposase zinc-binding domain/Putative transposase